MSNNNSSQPSRHRNTDRSNYYQQRNEKDYGRSTDHRYHHETNEQRENNSKRYYDNRAQNDRSYRGGGYKDSATNDRTKKNRYNFQQQQVETNFYFAKDKDLTVLGKNDFYDIPIIPTRDAFKENFNNEISLLEYISNYHMYNIYSDVVCEQVEHDHSREYFFKFLSIIPRLEMEFERAEILVELRQYYKDLLKELLDVDLVPKQSFNRWMFERKVLENIHLKQKLENIGYIDPILPSLLTNITDKSLENDSDYFIDPKSVSLRREILDDIPVKVNMFPKNANDAKDSITTYIDACKTLCKKDHIGKSFTDIEKEKIFTSCDNYSQWLDNEFKSNKREKDKEDNIMNKLREMKEDVGKLLQEKVSSEVDKLCSLLSIKSNYLLNTRFKSLLTTHIINDFSTILEPKECTSLHECLKVYFSQDKINTFTKVIEKSTTNNQVILNIDKKNSFKTESIQSIDLQCQLNLSHYEKLKKHFTHRLNLISQTNIEKRKSLETIFFTSSSKSTCLFDLFVYCLLLRYAAMFGMGTKKFEGSGLHAACPIQVFETLHGDVKVNSENFASPLNCYFPDFCSACGDIDYWFGSLGSFFEFFPTTGSFEANPPFSEELMKVMVSHMETLLDHSNTALSKDTSKKRPLSFFIVVPNWMDAPSLQDLMSSRHLTHELVLGASEHSYISGNQHNDPSMYRRSYAAVHETHVFVLQNSQASIEMPITDPFIERFKKAFAVKK
ncbi:hypothetical protein C9374_004908 [Naegleria lovaniensis]|uniref:PCIF1 WW domain-containing protein n=1 Tax=Naegleria lovaniensis TaxID=51637 RepID=A0AA88KNT7_NAELO|nr:uncharacterized protein C9374_004908 [Naegleria lovaniensis]KAG2382941.1 hypothetical protein C9374_004908 [Naegleria lovaniensis]